MNKKRLLPVVLAVIVLCISIPLAAQEAKNKKQPSEKVQKGIEYLYTGKRQEARQFFSGALSADPSDADACFYLGLSYYDENKFTQAKTYFVRAKGLYSARGDKEGTARAQDFINVLSCGSSKK
jgi:Tfp pilus assembly protein PilF